MLDARGMAALAIAGAAGGLVVLLFHGVLAARAQARRPAEVEAERFVLRDAQGAARAELFLDGAGAPHLVLRNPQGHRMVTLSAMADGSAGILVGDLDKPGNMPSALVVTRSGSPEMNLNGPGNISLRFVRGEGPKVLVFDEGKTLVFEAPPAPAK